MKFRKILSATLALAMSASAVAGLAVTANAATGSVELVASDDAYIQGTTGGTDYSAENYKDATQLYAGVWSDYWTSSTPGIKGYNANSSPNNVENLVLLQFNIGDYAGNITKATLTFDAVSAVDGTRSVYLAYPTELSTWDEDTITFSSSGIVPRSASDLNIYPFGLSKTVGTTLQEVSFSSSDTDTPTSYDGLDNYSDIVTYLNNEADDEGYITFIIYGEGKQCYINSKETTGGNAPTLTLEYASSDAKTVTFVEKTGAVSPIITVYNTANEDDEGTVVSSGSVKLEAGSYTFTATADGYEDYTTGAFDVEDEDLEVEFSMTAKKEAGSVVVKYVDSTGNEIGSATAYDATTASTVKYVGEDVTYYYPAYAVDANGILYSGAANGYSDEGAPLYSNKKESLTEADMEETVLYTKASEGTAQFVEAEDAIEATTFGYGDPTVAEAQLSSGWAVRKLTSQKYLLLTIEEDGIYNIKVPVLTNNTNTGTGTAYFFINDDSETLDTTASFMEGAATQSYKYVHKNIAQKTVALSKGDKIYVQTTNDNVGIDYILAERIAPQITEVEMNKTTAVSGTDMQFVRDLDDSEITAADAPDTTKTVTTYVIKVANWSSELGVPSITAKVNGTARELEPTGVEAAKYRYTQDDDGYSYFMIQTIGIADAASATFNGNEFTEFSE